ncbi:sensor histidine kinase [Parenemella sanctibonifatiensis]|uniref:histidine kinase n=1 Tax=Parenemella sanctibonifatiensis TaxID=2016505 RepID=A0A255EH96_9ACTN|nr:sensor histidine kinase [Parenemella sanctibonifatiensis]OYN88975.1 histidine kinase [Parenemella sanctibonifatiensis]
MRAPGVRGGDPGSQPLPRWFQMLMRHPGEPLASRRVIVVVAIGAAVVLTVLSAALLPTIYPVPVALAFAISALHSAGLLLALVRPWWSVAVTALSIAVVVPLTAGDHGFPWPVPVVSLLAVTVTCLLLAVREPWPVASSAAALSVTLATGWGVLLGDPADGQPISGNLVTLFSILILVIAFGVVIRLWVASRARAIEQQQRAEAESERRQLVEERSRIARELHDVVAHSLSVISIQASTVHYRIDGVAPEVVAELDDITASAREALVEMRVLLQVLRQDETSQDLTPEPTLSRIPDLVESTRRSGRTVHFETSGNVDESVVSDVNSLTAYRIVQEALSNAVRHAPGSEISVRLAVTANNLTITVENTPPDSDPHLTGSGLGLRGMRERAGAVGGTVRAGPTPEGGWAVRAVIPLRRPTR